MRHRMLSRKEKAPRQEKFLSEIDRLVCWKKLASCAELCLDEAAGATDIQRTSLEALVRVAVLQRCFGISPAALEASTRNDAVANGSDIQTHQTDLPECEEVESFFKLIAGCSLRGRIMRELEAQLAKVGVSLKRPLTMAPS